jgi:hypothetical protein
LEKELEGLDGDAEDFVMGQTEETQGLLFDETTHFGST